MPRSPKDTNKRKLKVRFKQDCITISNSFELSLLCFDQSLKLIKVAKPTVADVVRAVGVNRSTVHRWTKVSDRLAAARPTKCFVDPQTRAHMYVHHTEVEQMFELKDIFAD